MQDWYTAALMLHTSINTKKRCLQTKQCVLTGTVKKPICGHRSQQWKIWICGQWPTQRKSNQKTRTVNLDTLKEWVQRDQQMKNQSVKLKKKQCVLTRNVKKLICSHISQYKSVIEDCARTKPANQQDVSRWSLTQRRGRRYSTISQMNQEETSIKVTSPWHWIPDTRSAKCVQVQRRKRNIKYKKGH